LLRESGDGTLFLASSSSSSLASAASRNSCSSSSSSSSSSPPDMGSGDPDLGIPGRSPSTSTSAVAVALMLSGEAESWTGGAISSSASPCSLLLPLLLLLSPFIGEEARLGPLVLPVPLLLRVRLLLLLLPNSFALILSLVAVCGDPSRGVAGVKMRPGFAEGLSPRLLPAVVPSCAPLPLLLLLPVDRMRPSEAVSTARSCRWPDAGAGAGAGGLLDCCVGSDATSSGSSTSIRACSGRCSCC